MNTYGNCYRINNLELINKKSVICMHDAAYMEPCIAFEKAFTGVYPFGYMGTSPWLGALQNDIQMKKTDPVNLDISRLLFEQSDVGIVLYYVDGDPEELSRYFDFTKSVLPDALHVICAGDTAVSAARGKGFSLMAHTDAAAVAAFCRNYVDGAGEPRFWQEPGREAAEWVNVSFSTARRAKRLLLAGDSISCGYGGLVTDMLDEYSVDFLNTSEGTAHENIYRQLDIMMTARRYDVIHFNNGIHLHGISNESYGENLQKIWRHIREKAPEARLIFATTTTVSKIPEQPADFLPDAFQLGDRKPCAADSPNPYTAYDEAASARYRELNRIAGEACTRMGVAVNDLFALCEAFNPPKRDCVHFGEDGYRLLADAVAGSVVQANQRPAASWTGIV